MNVENENSKSTVSNPELTQPEILQESPDNPPAEVPENPNNSKAIEDAKRAVEDAINALQKAKDALNSN